LASLGAGGQAKALKCLHLGDNKEYAVKVVPCNTAKIIPEAESRRDANSKLMNDMQKEFELGTRAAHPNVAEYYGYGQD